MRFNVALAETESVPVPVMVEVVFAPTVVVVIVNVADVVPAVTVTDAGTVAAALLEVRLTKKPPVGAKPLRATVPVDEAPLRTVDGFKVIEATLGGVTTSGAEALPPVVDAVMFAVCFVTWTIVDSLNVAVVAPAGTTTLAGGRAAAVLSDDRVTVTPPVGAAAPRVTVTPVV